MHSLLTTIGRVTADPELRTGQSGNTYASFSIAVNKGYGEQQHPNFFQCILYSDAAQRFVNAGVKKGSLLWIQGDLDLVIYTSTKDQKEKTLAKLTVLHWEYVPGARRNESTENTQSPEIPTAGFQTVVDCGDNGLPFD